MYNHFELMRDRLPDNYNKNANSGITKLIKLASEQSNNNEASYELMRASRDIDNAVGPHLDFIGSNLKLKRGSWNDEQYRQMLKIQIAANLSNGDIPTLNKIYKAYLGDSFRGIQEGWSHALEEVAAIVIRLNERPIEVPPELNVRAGGVKIYYEIAPQPDQITFVANEYAFEVPLLVCGDFYAGSDEPVIQKAVYLDGSQKLNGQVSLSGTNI
ncbi:hypothetical protein NYE67_20415 [Solibacillus sp. FSL W8-0474]|uniref:hypothetical protein n=1 Tax=Solibacillus sp. FSL W8-0474 TaxID=2975336 RepID=UPI0030F5D3C0